MMDFKFCRNKNKGIVKAFVKHGKRKVEGKTSLNDAICFSEEVLQMMYLFARMMDLANENDLGFAAYWTSDNLGYLVTNIEGD